ncbi:MAG TPA: nucleotidyltransferase family protein, partial [Bryobacteraceae bacterium]
MHLKGYGPVKRNPKVPAYAWAVLDCLKLSRDKDRTLPDLSEAEWRSLLQFSDRAQLTLPLAQICGDAATAWVKRRLERNLAQNAQRWEKIKAAFNEYASALSLADIPYVLLKGFSHCPELVPDPRLRLQYDLDLLFLPQDIRRAYDVATRLGFEPLAGFDQYPTDHWPTMIRITGWEWSGDYFDTEIPVSLELHFRFWDERSERFAPDGLEQFWERRQIRSLEGVNFTALHPADIVGYACLHVLRHMLRGALRPAHVYELA